MPHCATTPFPILPPLHVAFRDSHGAPPVPPPGVPFPTTTVPAHTHREGRFRDLGRKEKKKKTGRRGKEEERERKKRERKKRKRRESFVKKEGKMMVSGQSSGISQTAYVYRLSLSSLSKPPSSFLKTLSFCICSLQEFTLRVLLHTCPYTALHTQTCFCTCYTHIVLLPVPVCPTHMVPHLLTASHTHTAFFLAFYRQEGDCHHLPTVLHMPPHTCTLHCIPAFPTAYAFTYLVSTTCTFPFEPRSPYHTCTVHLLPH